MEKKPVTIFFGHVMRRQKVENLAMTGNFNGRRKRGRKAKKNISQWADDQVSWRKEKHLN